MGLKKRLLRRERFSRNNNEINNCKMYAVKYQDKKCSVQKKKKKTTKLTSAKCMPSVTKTGNALFRRKRRRRGNQVQNAYRQLPKQEMLCSEGKEEEEEEEIKCKMHAVSYQDRKCSVQKEKKKKKRKSSAKCMPSVTKTGDSLSTREDCGELTLPTLALNMAFWGSVASAVVK